MLTSAEIEIIGYVGKDPIIPKPEEYPNFITFSVGVSKTWKDKEGKEQKVATWFDCHANSEPLAKVIKTYVMQGMGVLIKGYPRVKAYIDKSGEAKGSIEINISHMNLLINSKEKPNNNKTLRENLGEVAILDDVIPF